MKTLREYIDKLDEISRRDFLKGVGAAGLAGATGAAGLAAATAAAVFAAVGFTKPRPPPADGAAGAVLRDAAGPARRHCDQA